MLRPNIINDYNIKPYKNNKNIDKYKNIKNSRNVPFKRFFFKNRFKRRTRPWWWRKRFGLWWIHQSRPKWKWKRCLRWRSYIWFKKQITRYADRRFKIKSYFKFNLKLRASLKKLYGNLSQHELQKYILKKRNLRPEILSLHLRNMVSKLLVVRSIVHADQLITHGWITVNGRVIKNPKFSTKIGDIVTFNFRYGRFVAWYYWYFWDFNMTHANTRFKCYHRPFNLFTILKIRPKSVLTNFNFFYRLNR